MPANREPILTRIKNNQIVDQTITEAKVQDFTLSGGKLANNLVYGSSLTISGNLTVSGTTTTVDTTNTLIADPLLVLSKNASGTAAIDAGLVIERGTDLNVIMIWDESADQFIFAYSTEAGTTSGNVPIDSYANLQVAGFTANAVTAASITGNITSTGTSNLSVLNASGQVTFNGNIASTSTSTGTLVITGDNGGLGVAGNIWVGGTINANGNVTAGNVAATTFTGNVSSSGTSSLTTATVSNVLTLSGSAAATDTTSGALRVTGGAGIGGNVWIGGLVNVSGNLTAGNIAGATLTGNLESAGTTNLAVLNASGQVTFTGSIASTDKDSGALVIANGGLGVEGNVNVGAAANITGNLVAGNVSASALVGNVTSTGTSQFTVLNANGAVTFTDGTASTSTGSGALRITGGIGTQGNINVGGSNSTFTGATASTTTETGAVVVTGGVGIGGNLNVGGTVNKVTANTASSSHTSGALVVTGGVGVGGDINVDGSVIINQNLIVKGTTTTVNSTTTQLVDPIFQLGGGPNGATLTSGDNKDRGVSFKWFDGTAERTGFFGFDDTNGSFTYVPNATIVDEMVSGTPGTFVIGQVQASGNAASTSTDSGALTVAGGAGFGGNINVGGSTSKFTANVASSSTSTGAVVVTGGVGVGGNIYAGGNVVATGNVAAGNISAATLTGNIVSSGTSNLATVNANGQVTFTGEIASTDKDTGALVIANGGLGVEGNINVGGTNSTFTGATASSTTATGAVVVTGGVGIGGNLNVGGGANVSGNIVAGNVTATTFTGNVESTGTSNFSTANFSTLANVTSVTASTSTTTGALQVSGGVGVAGNINVGGPVNKFTGTTASSSNTTGAVTVAGGAGVAGNLYAANISVVDTTIATVTENANLVLQPNGTGATVINSAGANSDTVIKGDTDGNLFYVDASNDNIGVGTATPNAGAKLHISANSSVIIPVGTTAERPATPARGMMRYNTNVEDIEFWDGTMWQIASQDFTVITTESFSGDGSTTAFTLNAASTTASCIVSINGTVQRPVDSYGVSGTTLTFTEAPALGDAIEVRKLTTTGSIELALKEGYANVATINNGVLISTGTTAETVRVSIANTGVVTMSANVASTSTSSGTLVVQGGIGASGNVYAAKYYGDGSALTGIVSDNFAGGSVAGAVNITDATASTSTTTGALRVAGGVGVVGNVYAGAFYGSGAGLTNLPVEPFTGGTVPNATTFQSTVSVTSNTASTSTSTGALTVTGGVGIGGQLRVGSEVVATGGVSANGALRGFETGNSGLAFKLGKSTSFTNGDPTFQVTMNPNSVIMSAQAVNSTDDNFYITIEDNTDVGLHLQGPNANVIVKTTTAATSTTTGALRVAGGAGIGGNVYASAFYGNGAGLTGITASSWSGGTVANAVSITDATVSTSTTTGALTVTGGISTQGNLYAATVGANNIDVSAGGAFGGNLRIATQSITLSGSPTTDGVLLNSSNGEVRYSTTGTISEVRMMNIDRRQLRTSTVGSNTTWTDATTLYLVGAPVGADPSGGSVWTVTNPYVLQTGSGIVRFQGNLAATSTTTGQLRVTGGIGATGNVHAAAFYGDGSNLTGVGFSGGTVANATTFNGVVTANAIAGATSISTGALVVPNGGVGIAGRLYVGAFIYAQGDLDSTSTTSGTLQVTGGIGATGNVHAARFIGNGAGLTGITASSWSGGTVANAVSITSSTATTSATTGALTVTGGVGIGGNLWVGTSGQVLFRSTAGSSSTNSGALVVTGGAGIGANLWVGGRAVFSDNTDVITSTASTSRFTGALTVAGGVGVAGNVYAARFFGDGSGLTSVAATSWTGGTVPSSTTFQSTVAITDTTQSTAYENGALTVAGGVGIQKALWVSGAINSAGIIKTVASNQATNTSSGALQIGGGASIVGNLYVGSNNSEPGYKGDIVVGPYGVVTVANTTVSTSTTSGALRVSGGAGFGGNVYASAFYGNGAGLTGVTASSATTAATVTTAAQPNITSVGTLTSLTVSGTSNVSTLNSNGVVTLSSATASTSSGTGALVISTGGAGIGGNLYVGESVVVTGNLTVNGTTTTINSTTITVDDKNVVLGDITSPTDAGADGGGITLKGTTDKTIIWNNSTGRWAFNTGIDATSIQNTPIGNATASSGAFTTLTASGAVTFTVNTASTSTTTGSLVVTGGVGVSDNVYVGGDVVAQNVNSLSDERVKDNIETIESALDKTLALRGVSYTMRASGNRSVGVIAQEIEQVLPEVVTTSPDGIKSVSYGNIVGLLIEAIKEQQQQIEELKRLLAGK